MLSERAVSCVRFTLTTDELDELAGMTDGMLLVSIDEQSETSLNLSNRECHDSDVAPETDSKWNKQGRLRQQGSIFRDRV